MDNICIFDKYKYIYKILGFLILILILLITLTIYYVCCIRYKSLDNIKHKELEGR